VRSSRCEEVRSEMGESAQVGEHEGRKATYSFHAGKLEAVGKCRELLLVLVGADCLVDAT
jgi:hypothetical protein